MNSKINHKLINESKYLYVYTIKSFVFFLNRIVKIRRRGPVDAATNVAKTSDVAEKTNGSGGQFKLSMALGTATTGLSTTLGALPQGSLFGNKTGSTD